MRLTNVLNRCAAVMRAAAKRVGRSVGLIGRTVVRTVKRVAEPVVAVVRPIVSAVRAQLGRIARLAIPTVAIACSRHEGPPVPVHVTAAETTTMATAPPPVPAPTVEAPVPAVEAPIGDFYMTFYYIAVEDEISPRPARVIPPTSTDLVDLVPMGTSAQAAPPEAADVVAMVEAAERQPDARREPQPAANDNAIAGAAEDAEPGADQPVTVPMIGRDCQPLVEVSPAFAAQVRMQGTGRLRDGRLINVAGACTCGSCFHILPPGIPWGRGSSGLPLSPFRMVAVDPTLIKMGSLLYVPELDGMRMPGRAPSGGYVHDGCVVAADVGGAIKGRQLDLFVARRAYYEGLARRGSSHGWATSVEVWDGSKRCTRKGSKVSRSAAASI